MTIIEEVVDILLLGCEDALDVDCKSAYLIVCEHAGYTALCVYCPLCEFTTEM